jgi:phosphopantothenoylcysteine synthetase/decarboxylase
MHLICVIRVIRGSLLPPERHTMNVLVTAGNTPVPIDRVRCITNIFTGRTGARIALEARRRGHAVTLLTSHPEVVEALCPGTPSSGERWQVVHHANFADLLALMGERVRDGGFDAIVHCAAVSDYLVSGTYAPTEHTRFHPEDSTWASTEEGAAPSLVDRSAGKVKSDEPELWLRLVRAPKLIDCVRGEWHFRGLLVKFKLEVGVDDEQLLQIAERSRTHSGADLMVANTLEGADSWAFLGPLGGCYERVGRDQLAGRLLDALERMKDEG